MRVLVYAALFTLAIPAQAQTVSKDSLLQQSATLGNLVGEAVHCGVDQTDISRFLDREMPQQMPKTNDEAFNEQMNSTFERAMRQAGLPSRGCGPVVQRLTAQQ
jgi:hypothetical protein